jgi:hypothetical protein
MRLGLQLPKDSTGMDPASELVRKQRDAQREACS